MSLKYENFSILVTFYTLYFKAPNPVIIQMLLWQIIVIVPVLLSFCLLKENWPFQVNKDNIK